MDDRSWQIEQAEDEGDGMEMLTARSLSISSELKPSEGSAGGWEGEG